MTMTDPIADMLTRVRNANMALHNTLEVPGSNMKRNLAQILKECGFIKDFEWIEDGKQGVIKIHLKYGPDRQRVITGLKKISKPGLRVYASQDELPKVLGGLGVAVISTSKGLMTDKEARKQNVGGEVVCYIW
ncbi:30S ribosomal protein S8 [Proteinivorax hydrogeniformans]|uniref:Small ribosomal subunit protein uS8 n=1 Tax=Proteinivorax hydrogeniformans TaxID=1826727 RepID=A0AAU8HU38_9FIRM